jgi:hypothetical protein
MPADLAAGADAVDHAADVPSVTYGNPMARNIELKARIESVEAMRTKAAALADQGPIEILQEDTFFMCARGRLKLRAFSAHAGQLIFYQRPNQPGPKESFFIIAPTSSPEIRI